MGYIKVDCPVCGGHGTAAFNNETGLFRCNMCNARGPAELQIVHRPITAEEWKKKQPWYRNKSKHIIETPVEPIADKVVIEWFEIRGISESTLRDMRVTAGTDWMPANKGNRLHNGGECTTIHFNYVKDGEVVATKLRSGDKCFRMLTPDTEAIPYNIDSIKGMPGCYITEGEVDALSLHEIGLSAVISAISENEIHNVFESHLKQMDFIFICADHDKHGLEFAEKMKEYLKANMAEDATIEIISSYGTHPDGSPVKDANECLMLFGPEVLYDKIVNYKKAAKEQ